MAVLTIVDTVGVVETQIVVVAVAETDDMLAIAETVAETDDTLAIAETDDTLAVAEADDMLAEVVETDIVLAAITGGEVEVVFAPVVVHETVNGVVRLVEGLVKDGPALLVGNIDFITV